MLPSLGGGVRDTENYQDGDELTLWEKTEQFMTRIYTGLLKEILITL